MNHQLNLAKSQVGKQLNNIREIVAALKEVEGGSPAAESLIKTIRERAVSARVRSDWHKPGEKILISEYEILLSGQGVQVRIIGNLDQHGQPEDARLDYAAPMWTLFYTTEKDEENLLTYARQFNFL